MSAPIEHESVEGAAKPRGHYANRPRRSSGLRINLFNDFNLLSILFGLPRPLRSDTIAAFPIGWVTAMLRDRLNEALKEG